jgi:hypothetical protein
MTFRSADIGSEMSVGSVEQIYVRIVGRNVRVPELKPSVLAGGNLVNGANREGVRRKGLGEGEKLH